MTELFPKEPPNKKQNSLRCSCSKERNIYAVDENGIMTLTARPDCFEVCFMLPIFLCVGCCFSKSATLIFNDNSESVTAASWPGYCCVPPFYKKVTIPYGDIANVGIQFTGMTEGSEHNQQPIYDIVLITRQKQIFKAGPRGCRNTVEYDLLELHRFVFGRHNKGYVAPSPHSLNVPAPEDEWGCCCC